MKKLTRAGISSEILAIVDKIEKATRESSVKSGISSKEQSKMNKCAEVLLDAASDLMN